MTTQHPQPFSFGGGGSSTAIGRGRVLALTVALDVGCTLGIVLYPRSVPLVPGRLVRSGVFLISGGGGFSSGAGRSCSSFLGDSTRGAGAGLSSCTDNGANSRSYVVGTLPSVSHCSCASLRACVGSICWSGGSRGSGLYIVASHGGSPSGRLTAV